MLRGRPANLNVLRRMFLERFGKEFTGSDRDIRSFTKSSHFIIEVLNKMATAEEPFEGFFVVRLKEDKLIGPFRAKSEAIAWMHDEGFIAPVITLPGSTVTLTLWVESPDARTPVRKVR